MINMKVPKQYISVIFGKHLSSVYRELKRNSNCAVYTGREAQLISALRRSDEKPKPKTDNSMLMDKVMEMFKKDMSPEQISGRLKLQYGKNSEFNVSSETIYAYLYEKIANDSSLKKHFRHPRPKRQKRGGKKERRGKIPDQNPIENRPAIVNEKVRAGDWEGDTVEGAGKSAYIATFVDKTNKMLLARWMPNKMATTLNKAAARAFRDIPEAFRQTLTLDNGKEFAAHKALSDAIACPVYFAHPYHSWERGLNEHTNGLIRQYLPKGMSFDVTIHSLLFKASGWHL
jgi:IS30 family transposase